MGEEHNTQAKLQLGFFVAALHGILRGDISSQKPVLYTDILMQEVL